jgi:hypothetical protein
MWASNKRTLIRYKTKPFERIVNVLFGTRNKAGLVCVFDPNDEFPTGLPGD